MKFYLKISYNKSYLNNSYFNETCVSIQINFSEIVQNSYISKDFSLQWKVIETGSKNFWSLSEIYFIFTEINFVSKCRNFLTRVESTVFFSVTE